MRIPGNLTRGTILLLMALLGGCGTTQLELAQERRAEFEATNLFPENYKSDILAFMRTYLNDPTRVRDAAVTRPALKAIDGAERYYSCVRYNARKSSGEYGGPRESIVLYVKGRFDRFIERAREACTGAEYQPFPELGNLTR